jgi:uncharacterized protein YrzB (UPF0473 family)
MPERIEPYEHAERFTIDGEDGAETWVVLATDTVGGKEYALLASESSLTDDAQDDMDVMILEYRRGEEQKLADVENEATYEKVWQHFQEIMSFEPSDDA